MQLTQTFKSLKTSIKYSSCTNIFFILYKVVSQKNSVAEPHPKQVKKRTEKTWQSSNKTFKHLLFSFPIFVRTRLPVQRVCLKRKQKSKYHIYIWSRIRPDSQRCIQITKNKKHLIEQLISWKWMRILNTTVYGRD